MLDNFVQTFYLEHANLRGRIVRLGSVLHDILAAHDYPLPVAHVVGEAVTLTAALSSMLKYEGIFTLQTSGDGAIKMLVSDMTSDGDLRGCASYDTERLQQARAQIEALKTTESSQNHLAQYLGKGHLAFTVDQGANTERYQGIVGLEGASLVDCVQHYFAQSEQIGTGIKMAIGQRDGVWRGGAIMLQHMPEDDINHTAGESNINEDDWRRAMIFLESCKEDEFLDESISSEDLLFRLFHEEGLRVYPVKPVQKKCRCSEAQILTVLSGLEDDELLEMSVENAIDADCEFCSHKYVFNVDDLLQAKRGDTNV